MYDLKQLEEEKKLLKEKLAIHRKTKFNFLIKPIIIFPIATLAIPFIPGRGTHKSLATNYGAKESILFFAVFFSAVLIWMIIVKFNEYKVEKFDIETDVELIESKIARLKQ